MEQVSGLTFSKTINGLSAGQTISYACKFAFAGGLAVTKYFSYEVGSSCGSLSISDEPLENSILIYPNPVGNQLFIKSQSETITKVQIYTILGRLVKTTTINLEKVSVEELCSGLYMVQITTSKGVISKKLMKQ
jgi:endo-1,3(4)-beta-glucanase